MKVLFVLACGVPSLLLLTVAGTQARYAATTTLSPWKGGGFGMFSTTDGPKTRFIRVFAKQNGQRIPLINAPRLAEAELHARHLPSAAQAELLADAYARLPQAELLAMDDGTEVSPETVEVELRKVQWDRETRKMETIILFSARRDRETAP